MSDFLSEVDGTGPPTGDGRVAQIQPRQPAAAAAAAAAAERRRAESDESATARSGLDKGGRHVCGTRTKQGQVQTGGKVDGPGGGDGGSGGGSAAAVAGRIGRQ